ncbi:MAG: AMP-binding protein [Thermoanaerobaculia bacterium]
MSAPWLEHYDSGVPRTIGVYPEKTLIDVVRERAEKNPDAVALVFKGRKISAGELDRTSDALAHAFAGLGVKHGDRVALVLPNAPQFVICQFAAWKAGAIVAPQNPIYTERELEESLRTSQPETVVTLTPFYERVKRCQRAGGVKRVIATNIKEYFPAVLRVLFTLLKEKKDGHRITLDPDDVWLADLIRQGRSQGPFLSQARPNDDAMILMSGGTTGTPKGAVSDHRSLIIAGIQISTWMSEPLTAGGGIVLPLPLFHSYGSAGVLPAAMIVGVPVILIPNPRDIGDVVKTIAHEKPSVFCGVPTLFNAILAHPDVASGKVDFRSVKGAFSGAAALLAETKKRFEAVTGGRIIEAYSLTEATLAACINPYRGPNKIGSVGMPLPDVDVRIVDADSGTRELPSGETGEIVIRAPQLMKRYWNNPEETAIVLHRDADGSPALFTGDLGYLDEDGYLFIVDRKKDLIKTSGYQVWPREIEEVIATHPLVADVGVGGVPDARRGEAVMAWVVVRGNGSITVEELRDFCRGKLAPYKIPSRLEIRKELPKTMVGKVLRRVLVADAKAQMAEA